MKMREVFKNFPNVLIILTLLNPTSAKDFYTRFQYDNLNILHLSINVMMTLAFYETIVCYITFVFVNT